MIAVEIKGAKETAARLRELKQTLPTVVERQTARAGYETLGILKRRMTGRAPAMDAFWGRGGDMVDGFLGRRTGNTIDRLQGGLVLRVGDGAQTSVGSPDPHVKQLEDGGQATTAGHFRIPTAAAQTPSGVDRLKGASFRTLAGGFLFRSKAGKLWGAIAGPTGAPRLLYLFVKSITHKGHHVFRETTKDARPVVARYMGDAVSLEVRKANNG